MSQFVQLDNTLKKEIKVHKVKEALEQQLRGIPNVMDYKLSVQVTSLICNMIENSFRSNKTKYRIDKKEVVIQILTSIFALTEEEQKIADKQVEYLHASNQINAIPLYKIIGLNLLTWVKKKVI